MSLPIALLLERIEELEKALAKIERWHGEFPDSGCYYDEHRTRPMSYGAAFGSSGERDFMREVARKALNGS